MRVVMHMDLDEIIALNYYSSQLYMHGSSFGIYWIVKHAITGAEQSNFCVNAITLSFRLKLCSSFVVTSYDLHRLKLSIILLWGVAHGFIQLFEVYFRQIHWSLSSAQRQYVTVYTSLFMASRIK